MKRIIFVGIHNKPGMHPLDSRTKTGKIIDSVISVLSEYECIKSNLCDTEEFVTNSYQLFLENKRWLEDIKPTCEDVVITLGDWTYKNLTRGEFKIIKAKHPASLFGSSKVEEYVSYIVEKINKLN